MPAANATLIPNPDGLRVYDTYLKVNWLADANLPHTQRLPDGQPFDGTLGFPICDKTFLPPCIAANGAMSYDTAVQWVQRLNNLFGGAGFLNHHRWTLPRTLVPDPTCSVHDRTFGYNCSNSALGSLYYQSLPTAGPGVNLGFTAPDTTVATPPNELGPFKNFQPYLYWTSSAGSGSGENTFSFNTGWQGSNHTFHYMYVLPLINHRVDRPGISYYPLGPNHLEVSSDGKMVYDPDAVADLTTGAKGVTWLADANLPATEKFGIHCVNLGRPCIDADGSMEYPTAVRWLKRMNNHPNADGTIGWLGQQDWNVAPADPKGGCDLPFFHCKGGPMGELFFDQLGLSQGSPVFQMQNNYVGPFYNLQPYLYWACTDPDPCQGPPPPAGNQSWSFSFGNGFQGTDILANNLYVMVYYPQTPAEALDEAIKDELANYPQLRNQLLAEAAQINSATTFRAMLVALNLFASDVNAQLGTKLSGAQVAYLIALAQAVADATGLQPPPTPTPPPCKPNCI